MRLLLKFAMFSAAVIAGRWLFRALRQDRTPIPVEALVADGHFESLNHVRVHYKDTGKGPGVLLIGGLLGSTDMWALVAAKLAGSCRVMAIDSPGAGLSDKPVDLDYSPAAQGGAVAEFVRCKFEGPVLLVGSSTGARIALEAAAAAPDRVAGLVLLSPVVRLPWIVSAKPAALLGTVLQFTLSSRRLIRLAIRALLAGRQGPSRAIVDSIYLPARTRGFLPALAAMARQLAKPLDSGTIAKVSCPAWIVAGMEDRLARISGAPELVRMLGASLVLYLPRCGHWPQVSAPDRVAQVVEAFLTDLGALSERPAP